jgi:hypothetical protein
MLAHIIPYKIIASQFAVEIIRPLPPHSLCLLLQFTRALQFFVDWLRRLRWLFLVIRESLDACGGFLLIIQELYVSTVVDLPRYDREAGMLIREAYG